MYKRVVISIIFILLSWSLLNSCHTGYKKEMSNNCLILNDLSFEGKQVFLKNIKNTSQGNKNFSMNNNYAMLPYLFSIASEWLDTKQFKPVSQEKYEHVLATVFQINKDRSSDFLEITEEYLEYDKGKSTENANNNGISEEAFLFSPKHKLLLKGVQENVLIEVIGNNQGYKACIEENTYHYNNFLFHNKDSSLTWLLENDFKFLDALVRSFGYDQDSKLNQKVIQENYTLFQNIKSNDTYHTKQIVAKKAEILTDLFASKDLYGKLHIREGLLQSIVNMTTLEDNTYMRWMDLNYTFLLGVAIQGDTNTKNELLLSPFSSFCMEEKIKILAYTCYYTEQAYLKNGRIDSKNETELWLLRTPLNIQLQQNPLFLEHLKKNAYYRLPGYQAFVSHQLKLTESMGW